MPQKDKILNEDKKKNHETGVNKYTRIFQETFPCSWYLPNLLDHPKEKEQCAEVFTYGNIFKKIK